VGIGLVAASQFASPEAAQAAAADCPAGSLCLWGDNGYNGRYVFVPNAGDLLTTPNIGNAMNDLTSSLWNRTGTKICFYEDDQFRKFLFSTQPTIGSSGQVVTSGDVYSSLGVWNDKVTSFRPC
jgi:hypothetical protein